MFMNQLAYVIALVISGAFVVGGLAVFVHTAFWVSAATWKAEATVVDIQAKASNGEITHYPVFRFEARGREWEVVNPLGSSGLLTHRKGDRVTAYYPPHAPEKARIGRERHLLLPAFILLMGLLMGILILIFGPPEH